MNRARFCIKTLGCKINQYESQVIRERFLKNGYVEAESFGKADVCIVNTCTVTSASDSKSLKLIHNALKEEDKCVIATGCMVEDADLDLSRLAGVRFIIKNKDKYRIPDIITKGQQKQEKAQIHGISGFKGHTRVFVKIQDGCDNACSYCKVRIARGRSRSRSFKEILDECRSLIRNGSKEIVLSGICLGAYGKELSGNPGLSKLIKELCKIGGNWRLRLSSIEPKDINKELIHQLYTQKKLCKHLHIPFQSGDTRILKKMDRPYTRKGYLNIIKRLKNAIPDIAISTDIMVGFPGETEKSFRNTLNFLKVVRPMRIHVFPFSKRKGTKAYSYRDDVAGAVKKERKDSLLHLAGELSMEFVDRFVGKEVEVLVENRKSNEERLQGYTERYIRVYIDGPDRLKGQLVNYRML